MDVAFDKYYPCNTCTEIKVDICKHITVLCLNDINIILTIDQSTFVDQFLCFLNVLRFDVVHYIVRIILISFKHSTIMCLHMSTFISVRVLHG